MNNTIRNVQLTAVIFVLAATIIAFFLEVREMYFNRNISLADLLLMFIYIEVIGLVRSYWETQSVRIIYPMIIAITALARYIILQDKNDDPLTLVYLSIAILIISLATVVIRLRNSKILKIDYRIAEAKKIKFSKNKNYKNINNENELLKKIINSRLEEIIELLFNNCPLVKNNVLNSKLSLYFTGNGSKVLNENLLSFGPEFDFVSEMSTMDEFKKDLFDTTINFHSYNQKLQPSKSIIKLENKGFFEKLFEYFSRN